LHPGGSHHEFLHPITQFECCNLPIKRVDHTPKPRKQFACDQCDKVYPRNQSLQAHIIQVHSDIKPFTCRICRKGFVRRWDFYRHLNAVHRDRARDAIDADKVEEYVTWMRSRTPTDISWECLNAVREEFPSASTSSAVAGNAVAPVVSSSVTNPVVPSSSNSGTPKPASPPPSVAAPPSSSTSGVTVTMIKPANE
uniref:Zinc finger protein n=1 Tax=Mesocestoides corti TaxID=53468 RepID=A0A5K3FQR2_MESCO